jgi:hypothetical protein
MAGFSSTRSAGALVLCLSLLASACASDAEISTEATVASTAPATGLGASDTAANTNADPAPAEPETTEQAPVDEPDAMQEPAEPAPAAVAFDLPSVELTNVATGDAVDLATVADGKPLVLWFWAPH